MSTFLSGSDHDGREMRSKIFQIGGSLGDMKKIEEEGSFRDEMKPKKLIVELDSQDDDDEGVDGGDINGGHRKKKEKTNNRCEFKSQTPLSPSSMNNGVFESHQTMMSEVLTRRYDSSPATAADSSTGTGAVITKTPSHVKKLQSAVHIDHGELSSGPSLPLRVSELSPSLRSSLSSKLSYLFLHLEGGGVSEKEEKKRLKHMEAFFRSLKSTAGEGDDDNDYVRLIRCVWEYVCDGMVDADSRWTPPHFRLACFLFGKATPVNPIQQLRSCLVSFLVLKADTGGLPHPPELVTFTNSIKMRSMGAMRLLAHLLARDHDNDDEGVGGRQTLIPWAVHHLFSSFLPPLLHAVDVVADEIRREKSSDKEINQHNRKPTNWSVAAMDLMLLCLQQTCSRAIRVAIMNQSEKQHAEKGKNNDALMSIVLHFPEIRRILERRRAWLLLDAEAGNGDKDNEDSFRHAHRLSVHRDLMEVVESAHRAWLEDDGCGDFTTTSALRACAHMAGMQIPLDDNIAMVIGGVFYCLRSRKAFGHHQNRRRRHQSSVRQQTNSSLYRFCGYGGEDDCESGGPLEFVTTALSHAVATLSVTPTVKTELMSRDVDCVDGGGFYNDSLHPPSLRLSTTKETNAKAVKVVVVDALDLQRCVVRAVASVLSSRSLTKWFGDNVGDDDATYHQIWKKLLEGHLNLLRSKSKECVELSLVTLDILWRRSPDNVPCFVHSDSNGDDDDRHNGPRQTLLYLMEQLNQSLSSASALGVDDDDDSSMRVLCSLIARTVRSDPRSLLPVLLERSSHDTTTKVLSALVSISSCHDENDKYLNDSLVQVLLSDLSDEDRHRRCESPAFFLKQGTVETELSTIVRNLLGLCCDSDNNATATSKLSSTRVASGILCHALIRGTPALVSRLVPRLIQQFVELQKKGEKEDCQNSSKKKTDLRKDQMETAATEHVANWRRALLSSSITTSHRYGEVLMAVGRFMLFDKPSQSLPLVLLGAMVDGSGSGNHDDFEDDDKIERHRRREGIQGLLTLAVERLEGLGRSNDERERETTSESDDAVFRRLSPLLLMRRIPVAQCRSMLFGDALSNNELFRRLSSCLAGRLTASSSEERRLAAEVAGRCLPVTSLALFMWQPTSQAQPTTTLSTMAMKRSVLYAACHAVASASDDEDGGGLMECAAWSFHSLRFDAPENDEALRTGCVEFWAICLDSWAERNLRRRQRQRRRDRGEHDPSPLIVEQLDENNDHDKNVITRKALCDKNAPLHSHLSGLTRLFSFVLAFVMNGEEAPLPPPENRWRRSLSSLPVREDQEVGDELTTLTAKICFLQAIVLNCQRCPDLSRLEFFASAALPRLIEWASSSSSSSTIASPSVVAGVLQVTFVCVTRLRKLTFLGSGVGRVRVRGEQMRSRLRRWARESVRPCHIEEQRMAGLKLLLALVLVGAKKEISKNNHNDYDDNDNDNDDADDNSVEDDDMVETRETLSVLRGAAHVDPCPSIRGLATQVLQALGGGG